MALALAHVDVASEEALVLFGELSSLKDESDALISQHLHWLAICFLERSKPDDAEPHALKAYELRAQSFGDEVKETQRSILLLTLIYQEKGFAEMEIWLECLHPPYLLSVEDVLLSFPVYRRPFPASGYTSFRPASFTMSHRVYAMTSILILRIGIILRSV